MLLVLLCYTFFELSIQPWSFLPMSVHILAQISLWHIIYTSCAPRPIPSPLSPTAYSKSLLQQPVHTLWPASLKCSLTVLHLRPAVHYFLLSIQGTEPVWDSSMCNLELWELTPVGLPLTNGEWRPICKCFPLSSQCRRFWDTFHKAPEKSWLDGTVPLVLAILIKHPGIGSPSFPVSSPHPLLLLLRILFPNKLPNCAEALASGSAFWGTQAKTLVQECCLSP